MPIQLLHPIIALAFLAVCALAGEILVRHRRGEGGMPPPRDRPLAGSLPLRLPRGD